MLTWIKNLITRPSYEELHEKVLGHKLIAKELLRGRHLVFTHGSYAEPQFLYCLDKKPPYPGDYYANRLTVIWYMYFGPAEYRTKKIVYEEFSGGLIAGESQRFVYLDNHNEVPRNILEKILEALQCQK